ncbi:T9SS type A sorting domain-containing protein [Rubrivirga litoralis]|uniref:T9SS type A sorting domain-containing protein n=1 Tax=Rubrivirga litoralis TaxID=3075598 RepID=A0ABU3BNP0_9BACT|nr:T9SS type A sorting domain-containing protein [Rubrivirga sp. F394]MDT0630914.1 T9SS type A sorting domain-containing protein [Rubrivirga sp. F394]
MPDFFSCRSGRVLIALFALLAAPLAVAQSELAVAPGVGTLNETIAGDIDRPADRVYVLERGGSYAVTGEITNEGFVLRLRAADGEGPRPVIYPGPEQGSRFFRLLGDASFDGLYVLGVRESGAVSGIPIAVQGEGQRLDIDDSVFEGARSRFFEIDAADTRVYVRNSQFRNFIRTEILSSNGRAFDYRDKSAKTLLIENTSFLGINGYIVRYDGPVIERFVFNHNTVHTTSNEVTTSSLGTRVVEYEVTNNLFVNVHAPGQAPAERPDGILSVNAFEGSGFFEADRQITIANNDLFTSQDLLDFYEERGQAGDPLVPFQLIQPSSQDFIEGSNVATATDNINVPVSFAAPPSLEDYIAWLAAIRDGAAEPPTWAFGSDNALFPAEQPLPEDLSYGTDSPAYTAAEGGFPVGDLNWFPERKAAWEAGGGAVPTEGGPDASGFALHGTYPNPSAGAVTVRFDLDAPGTVSARVFDLLGREVLSSPPQAVSAGAGQLVSLDASALPAGLYLYRVTAETGGSLRSQTGRLTLAR